MPKTSQHHRILIVDDHAFTRTGLKADLSLEKNITVVGEARHGEQALAMIPESRPSVILMDVGMPIMDGISATKAVKQNYPNVIVIMLTSHNDADEVWAALSAGAQAYCLKDINHEQLMKVLDSVSEGGTWLDPGIAHILMDSSTFSPQEEKKDIDDLLTQREQEVLQLLVNGLSNQEIADKLQVTLHTAKAHISNIIQKLAVSDRTQAAVLALRQGWAQ